LSRGRLKKEEEKTCNLEYYPENGGDTMPNLATLDMNDVAEGPVKGNEAPNVINGLNL